MYFSKPEERLSVIRGLFKEYMLYEI